MQGKELGCKNTCRWVQRHGENASYPCGIRRFDEPCSEHIDNLKKELAQQLPETSSLDAMPNGECKIIILHTPSSKPGKPAGSTKIGEVEHGVFTLHPQAQDVMFQS